MSGVTFFVESALMMTMLIASGKFSGVRFFLSIVYVWIFALFFMFETLSVDWIFLNKFPGILWQHVIFPDFDLYSRSIVEWLLITWLE